MGGKNSVLRKPLGTGKRSVNAFGRKTLGSNVWDSGAAYQSAITGNLSPAQASARKALFGDEAPIYEGPGTSAMYTPGGYMTKSKAPGGYMEVGGGINRYGEFRPGQTILRDESGQLHENFRAGLGDSYSALKDKAMTAGDTKSAMLARQAQDVMRQQDVDRLRSMQNTGVTQGMRNLAMRGGVGQGSRERLMRDATRAGMRGMQGIGRENRLANLQISQADEAMKNQLLQGVGGAEQSIQNQNIKMLAQDIAAQNLAAQNLYSEDMRALGAIETGKAQASAAKPRGGLFK